MNNIEQTLHIARLTGEPGSQRPLNLARPGFDHCSELVSLVLETAPHGQLRREWWGRDLGVTVSVGAEHGLLLGLDFPAGELGGPEGGWLRMRRNGPALHWRIARTQARWIWAIVRREVEDDGAEPAESAAAAHGPLAVYV